jgi:oxygen-independent coproporphyrinogen-3 oxidase
LTGAPDWRPARPAHLYVHVPFCARKCAYCDFVSYPLAAAGGEPAIQRYLDALAREAGWYAERLAPAPLATVYIGGGTPTILSAARLTRLLAVLSLAFGPWAKEAEVTVEANPGTVDAATLAALRKAGANRLSLGVQSFDEGLLRRVGRIVAPGAVRRTVQAARAAGFANLSLDLILGLPGQTAAKLWEDLRQAVELAPEHLSVYALTLGEGAPLTEEVAAGRVSLLGEDAEAEMLALARAALREAGYRHYEIANFARPGYESRHNLAYWHNEDYLALGPSAGGHQGLLRYRNAPGFADYLRLLSADGPGGAREEPSRRDAREDREGFLPSPAAVEVERLSLRQAQGETAFLALRLLAEGLDREGFRHRYGQDPIEVWGEEIAQLKRQGLLAVTLRTLRLTERGLPVANRVFAAFV